MQLLDRNFNTSVEPVRDSMISAETARTVEQFLYYEARLLDERRFEEWLGQWDENGRYWVPRFHNQENPFDQVSLFWEDKMLREVRVRRVSNSRNWSQQPPTRSSRLVGNITLLGLDAEEQLIVRSVVHYTEWRNQQRHLAGTVYHKLVSLDDGSWSIRLKRVDLVNCDDVFANLEVFI
uniref:aromatic-ring-hydroxylating dioxygenase subunit beta n=1 Tax=Cupriavidus yeoncheonensis TaxID=1462994 RepID=UPI003F493BB5